MSIDFSLPNHFDLVGLAACGDLLELGYSVPTLQRPLLMSVEANYLVGGFLMFSFNEPKIARQDNVQRVTVRKHHFIQP